MASQLDRAQHAPMYTAMLDLISNRVQLPDGLAGSKSEEVAMDHRWGARVNVGVQVRLHAASWRMPRLACLRDISVSGALLELDTTLPPLKRIEVEIAQRIEGRTNIIRIPACVVRRADCGVGVEWCEQLPSSVDQLVTAVVPLWTLESSCRESHSHSALGC